MGMAAIVVVLSTDWVRASPKLFLRPSEMGESCDDDSCFARVLCPLKRDSKQIVWTLSHVMISIARVLFSDCE